MKKTPRKPNLAQTQKRRQWEFFNLRDQANRISKLLGLEHDEEKRKELEAKYNALQVRGQQILEEQTKFLVAKHRPRSQKPKTRVVEIVTSTPNDVSTA